MNFFTVKKLKNVTIPPTSPKICETELAGIFLSSNKLRFMFVKILLEAIYKALMPVYYQKVA